MLCNSNYPQPYYGGIVGSVLAAVFSTLLVWVAWSQLGRLGTISSADFIYKLNTIFFTNDTRTLMSLIDCDALAFTIQPEKLNDPDNNTQLQPYFEVIESQITYTKLPPQIQKSLIDTKYYSMWQIDDLLLGHFEDIGRLEQRGIIDFQMIYDVFSWYITTVWQYTPIKEYIRYQRIGQDSSPIDVLFYNQFQHIAIKCLEYEKLHSGPCKWWWQIKRYFRRPKIERNI